MGTRKSTDLTQAILKNNYEYRRRLPHYQKDNHAIFVSFRVGGSNVLPENVRDIVLKHCLHDHETKARFHAVVVMPDHVHLLLTPLRNANGDLYSLIETLQAIKSVSAHSVNRALNRRRPLWQEESFDHVLRTDEGLEQKREYIRQNPVRKGLVKKPEDYPWVWLEPA